MSTPVKVIHLVPEVFTNLTMLFGCGNNNANYFCKNNADHILFNIIHRCSMVSNNYPPHAICITGFFLKKTLCYHYSPQMAVTILQCTSKKDPDKTLLKQRRCLIKDHCHYETYFYSIKKSVSDLYISAFFFLNTRT